MRIFSKDVYTRIFVRKPWNVGSMDFGFGDTSKKAFCANAYLVYQQTSGVYSRLIAAKPRVAPVKKRTIPRLELMSTRILTTLTNTVRSALESQREIKSTTLWLDSKTVLCWLLNRVEWKQQEREQIGCTEEVMEESRSAKVQMATVIVKRKQNLGCKCCLTLQDSVKKSDSTK